MSQQRPTVLITGASAGIGAVYADRFARRGHDLVLVARDAARLHALASKLAPEMQVSIEILPADLTSSADLARVETRLREDERIGVLVNNAGVAARDTFANSDVDSIDKLIRLNVIAVTRLTYAVVPRFLRQGGGAIVNVASIAAVAPELTMGAYGASKAYVVALSQTLQAEVGSRGIYVQVVVPSATRTELWERSGRTAPSASILMEPEELVDAALVGFDRREAVTVPTLHDWKQWETYDAARRAMLPNLLNVRAAERYKQRGE